MNDRATFTRMDQSTQADWQLVIPEAMNIARSLRDRFQGHEHDEHTAELVELYDNLAFDPAAPAEPIEVFTPMLRRVMATVLRSPYLAAVQNLGAASHETVTP